MEELDANQIKIRLEVTEQQIGLLESLIEKASKQQEGKDLKLYEAEIAGYNSFLSELQEKRDEYRVKLGLK